MNIAKQTVLILTAAVAVPVAAQAQLAPDIVGTWHGAAMSPAGEITLVLHVERGADATLSAKIENATQAPGNLAPVSDIKVTNGHLAFRMNAPTPPTKAIGTAPRSNGKGPSARAPA